MADYQRLVSYIYNYEFNIKKNNVGYARVESRNGQCKITVHIKVLTMNEKTMSVYFFYRESGKIKCVLLGIMSPRNGSGDFQVSTLTGNIMNSGFDLDDMAGILVFSSEEKYFGTQWDDKAITINELEIAEKKEETVREKTKEEKGKSISAQLREEVKAANIENELFLTEEKMSIKSQETEEAELQNAMVFEQQNPVYQQVDNWMEKEDREELAAQSEEDEDKKNRLEKEFSQSTASEEAENTKNSKTTEQKEKVEEVKIEPALDSLKAAQTAPNFKNKKMEQDRMSQVFTHYPKMYPFEDNEILECIRIEPQDIGILPMDSWILANNSFLLHGFYSYRHLIFAKKKLGDSFQYILGIPGIYHNREKFMARMFGFEQFKSINNKEQKTGEFGYWYHPVSID